MYEDLALYIDGEFIHGDGRREQPVYDPATGDVIANLPHATRVDLDRALAAAQRAFESWKSVSPMEKSRILRKAGEMIRERGEGNWPQHYARPRQAACRVGGRGYPLCRSLRLARGGVPAHLWSRDPAEATQRAPDGSA